MRRLPTLQVRMPPNAWRRAISSDDSFERSTLIRRGFHVTYSFTEFLGAGDCAPKSWLTACSVFRQTALDGGRNRLRVAM